MKHNLRLKMLLGAILLIASASIHAESQELPSDSAIQAEFPAPWMEHMIQAYEDFRTNHDDLSCFSVWAFQQGDSFFVIIAGNMDAKVEDGELKIPIVPGSSPCGYGAVYEFDGTGKLIRNTGMR